MKKIILILAVLLSFFSFNSASANETKKDNTEKCKIDVENIETISISDNIEKCKPENAVEATNWKIENWFKAVLWKIIKNMMYVIWAFAIFAIVFGWFNIVISAWDDEKLKKWKDIVKWGALWFLWAISAAWLIPLLINFIYSIDG